MGGTVKKTLKVSRDSDFEGNTSPLVRSKRLTNIFDPTSFKGSYVSQRVYEPGSQDFVVGREVATDEEERPDDSPPKAKREKLYCKRS